MTAQIDNFATNLSDRRINKNFSSTSLGIWKFAQKTINQFIDPAEYFSGGPYRTKPAQYHHSFFIGGALLISCAEHIEGTPEEHDEVPALPAEKGSPPSFLGFSIRTIFTEPAPFLIVWRHFQAFISEYALFSGVVSELAPVKVTTMLRSYYAKHGGKSKGKIRSEKEGYLAGIRKKYGSFKGKTFKASRYEEMSKLCRFIIPTYRKILHMGVPFLWNALPERDTRRVSKKKAHRLFTQKMKSPRNIPFFMANTSHFLLRPDTIPKIRTGTNGRAFKLRDSVALWEALITDLDTDDLEKLCPPPSKFPEKGKREENDYGKSGQNDKIAPKDFVIGKKAFLRQHEDMLARIAAVKRKEGGERRDLERQARGTSQCPNPQCKSHQGGSFRVSINERTGEYVCTG